MSDTPPAPLDLTEWIADLPRIPDHAFRDAMQALFDERKRRDAQPAVTAARDEIARAWHEQHPPEVDEATGHPVWVQPTGAHDAWPIGATVVHEGRVWTNTAEVPNVWAPNGDGPVPTWTEIVTDTPTEPGDGPAAWAPDTTYATGDTVTHDGTLYTCTQGHRSQSGWEPPNTPAMWAVAEEATP